MYKKYNKLTIIKNIGFHINPSGCRKIKVLCICDCGNYKEVLLNNIVSGGTKSCGCYNKKIKITHNMSRTRFYRIYDNIQSRCSNNAHKRYFGRGIKCVWRNFTEFKKDMYETYLRHCELYGEKNTTIDRLNNDGNYSKVNCRWATSKQQNNNFSRNKKITYNNITMNIGEWAEAIGINKSTLSHRFLNKWSIERALSEPLNIKYRR